MPNAFTTFRNSSIEIWRNLISGPELEYYQDRGVCGSQGNLGEKKIYL